MSRNHWVSVLRLRTLVLLRRGWSRRVIANTNRLSTALDREQVPHGTHHPDRNLARIDRVFARVERGPYQFGSHDALRGYIRSEVNRCLNGLVRMHAPAEIIVEKLDFRALGLSRRLNRLLSNMGRGSIEAKLREREERFGIKCRKSPPPIPHRPIRPVATWTKETARSRLTLNACGAAINSTQT